MYVLTDSFQGWCPFLLIKVVHGRRHNRCSRICSRLTLGICNYNKVSLVEGSLDDLWFPSEGVALSKEKIGVLLPLAVLWCTSYDHLRVHVMYSICTWYISVIPSRYTVMCWWPRKLCDAQVCYIFTATANSPFSTLCTSITTRPISIKFTCFMPSIYSTPHTNFERNRPSSLRDTCSWNMPHFLHLFFL